MDSEAIAQNSVSGLKFDYGVYGRVFSSKAVKALERENLTDFGQRHDKITSGWPVTFVLSFIFISGFLAIPFEASSDFFGFISPGLDPTIIQAPDNVYVSVVGGDFVEQGAPVVKYRNARQLVQSASSLNSMELARNIRYQEAEGQAHFKEIASEAYLVMSDGLIEIENRMSDLKKRRERIQNRERNIVSILAGLEATAGDKRTVLEFNDKLDEALDELERSDNAVILLEQQRAQLRQAYLRTLTEIESQKLTLHQALMSAYERLDSIDFDEVSTILAPVSGNTYYFADRNDTYIRKGAPLMLIHCCDAKLLSVVAYVSDISGIIVDSTVEITPLLGAKEGPRFTGIVRRITRSRVEHDYLGRKMSDPLWEVGISLSTLPKDIQIGNVNFAPHVDMKVRIRFPNRAESGLQIIKRFMLGK